MSIRMSEKEALENGFTNHGRMFSVPIWVTDTEAPMVAAKFAPFEMWIALCTKWVQFMGFMGADVAFPIMIGPEIKRP